MSHIKVVVGAHKIRRFSDLLVLESLGVSTLKSDSPKSDSCADDDSIRRHEKSATVTSCFLSGCAHGQYIQAGMTGIF